MESDTEIYAKYRDDLLRYATDDPRSYLLKAVLNEARGLARRRRPLPLDDEAMTDRPIELLDVVAALRGLPVRQRAALYLYYWEQLPVAEVAAVMGLRDGTVKRYLHLGRNRLKGVL